MLHNAYWLRLRRTTAVATTAATIRAAALKIYGSGVARTTLRLGCEPDDLAALGALAFVTTSQRIVDTVDLLSCGMVGISLAAARYR